MKKKVLVDMSATLIHNGHIRLLKKASKLGEVIVALTTDTQIKKYKHYYPELTYNQRKEIINSIRYVTRVIPTNWLIDDNFLKKFKIDYLVHGKDNCNNVRATKLKIYQRTKNVSSSELRKKSARIYNFLLKKKE